MKKPRQFRSILAAVAVGSIAMLGGSPAPLQKAQTAPGASSPTAIDQTPFEQALAQAKSEVMHGDFVTAKSDLDCCDRLAKDDESPDEAAAVLVVRARVLAFQQDPTGAINLLTRARSAFEKVGDRSAEGDCLVDLAGYYSNMRQQRQADQVSTEAIRLFGSMKTPEADARRLETQSNLDMSHKEFGKALESADQALGIERKLGDERGIAHALMGRGYCNIALQRWDGALDDYVAALKLGQQLKDRQTASAAVANLIAVYGNLGFNDKFQLLQHEQMAMARGDDGMNGLGTGPPQEMTTIDLGEPDPPSKGLFERVYNKAMSEYALGQYSGCDADIMAALDLAKEHGRTADEANVLNVMGNSKRHTNDFDLAVGYHDRALALYSQIEDKKGIAETLVDRTYSCAAVGLWDKEEQSAAQALATYRAIGDQAGIASALDAVGRSCMDQHNPKEALVDFEQSRELAKRLGDKAIQAESLTNAASADVAIGNTNGAVTACANALDLYESIHDEIGKAACIEDLVLIYRYAGQNDQATTLEHQFYGLDYTTRTGAMQRRIAMPKPAVAASAQVK